jgi:hypothetical protein
VGKKVWRKPEVKELKAGAAEINAGANDDADPGSANNNS